jgi:hypothetical protein
MDDRDIWRAANLLIDRHGDEASLVAGTRADEGAERDDATGERIWRLIQVAVLELQAPPAAGQKPN